MTKTTQHRIHANSGAMRLFDLSAYDRSPIFSDDEQREITFIAARTGGPGSSGGKGGSWPGRTYKVLDRLLLPIFDACALAGSNSSSSTNKTRQQAVVRAFVIQMDRLKVSYWGWTEEQWLEFIGRNLKQFNESLGWSWSQNSKPCAGTRTRCLVAAYCFGGISDPRKAGEFKRVEFAECVFGKERVYHAIEEVTALLISQGYSPNKLKSIKAAICEFMIVTNQPMLEEMSERDINYVYETALDGNKAALSLATRAFATLGYIDHSIQQKRSGPPRGYLGEKECAEDTWVQWCDTWYAISTLEARTKDTYYRVLILVGRWLKDKHPDIVSPEQWGATTATDAVSMICSLKVGQYVLNPGRIQQKSLKVEKPLKPRSISGYIAALRTFFIDLQSAERIPLHFSAKRYFTVPRTVRRKIRPNPRTIDKGVWAKMVWSGQNLTEKDLTSNFYPLAMVKAIAAVWLFTGLRSDEIARLTLGCIEWPSTEIHDIETDKILSIEDVCYLYVPTNKTTGSFKKPVSPYVGKMIDDWVSLRPEQPKQLDDKSAEITDYLFSLRGKKISKSYINNSLIPMLCRKAGFDPQDNRGSITSHRARATIATYLGNSENPMSLIQLMKWLGHKSSDSTRSYVEADISKMAVKIAEGHFFQQNLASIPVILDNDAISSGAAASGEPWKYFDLGHGFCNLSEWSSCRHRMACGKCDFFEPKESLKMQLLEANGNLTKMLEFVALTDDEKHMIEQGIEINSSLLGRLKSSETPDGRHHEMDGVEVEATTTVNLIK